MVCIYLVGHKFGRLTVVSRGPNDRHGKARWHCECECGGKALVGGSNLLKGNSNSCGCLHKEQLAALRFKHGASGSPLYRIYSEAKQRCTNPNSKNWKDYGGRGIEFRFTSFEQFSTALGAKPSKYHTLDRIDNSGHYEPGNVRWATMAVQCSNRRKCVGEHWKRTHGKESKCQNF